MGKGTDKLYITHSEWSSSDAFSASSGARSHDSGGSRPLPFNFCAASLQPFKNPWCTAEGTIFDLEIISAWLEKHDTNPINGEPLRAKDLIRLVFARNPSGNAGVGTGDGGGDLVDPVTFKVFTDNTHIVAIRHGDYANVFAWETVERMNVKAKMWLDLVDDQKFSRADIITLQDPHNAAGRDVSRFRHLNEGGALLSKEQEDERKSGNVNAGALGRMGDKILKAKMAVEKARKTREAAPDINKSAVVTASSSSARAAQPGRHVGENKPAPNAAVYTTGKAAASFTSTGLTPETSGERALLTDEEYLLKPKRVKHKGYARIESNLGDLTVELHTETAPKAVWNFVRLAQGGFYRDVSFHRNIPNFMIQGGDPSGDGRGGRSIWGKYFEDELSGPHTHSSRGVLSMANKGKNTNSSQFFVTYAATPHLDRKHTVFGRVIGGNDVLAKMEAVPTDGSSRPLHRIFMKDVVVFLDPFEEYQKESVDAGKAEKEKAERRSRGGTDDDKTTWTGKRIRDSTSDAGAGRQRVIGKYLSKERQPERLDFAEAADAWEEPAKKKSKASGFGNFDGW